MSSAAEERAVSCAFIRSSGGYAVKVRKGTKAAESGWSPRDNCDARSSQVLAQLEDSDDNIGVHFQGRLVDVDVDGKEAETFLTPALDLLLPDCAHIWGRKSRPRTHRSYMIDGERDYNPLEHPVLRRIKRIQEVKVELRGGPKSRGEYTVAPGSIHPDGELYEWADKDKALSTPSVAPLPMLLRGIRMAGAIAVIAPHWQEGIRQELVMALSGFLHRANDLTQSIDANLFGVSKEDALTLLEVLFEVTHDDSSDLRMRRQAFEATWKKADQGVPVMGATSLAKMTGDHNIVSKLYTLLSDSPEVAEIDDFVSRFAIWQGPAVAIDRQVLRAGGDSPLMSRERLKNSFGHLFVTVADKRKLLPDMLWSMNAATRVGGLTFAPGHDEVVDTAEGSKLNQWAGFAVEPWQDPVLPGQVEPFLDYLHNVVCGADQESYDWVLGWLAHIFQTPAEKAGTALVLVGRSGVGKTFLGEQIIGKIIGDRHYIQTNAISHVVDKFNAAYTNKLLIQCDEAMSARQRVAASQLKALITDSKQRVEPKGVDVYQVPLHARFLFTSNETAEAIHLDQGYDDRRYTVLEVSPVHKGQLHDYWSPLVKWLNEDGTFAKIHRFLLDHEYDTPFIRLPIRSAAKERMQQRSWDAFDGWLAQMLSREHPLSAEAHNAWWDAPWAPPEGTFTSQIERVWWPTWISMEALERDFRMYVKSHAPKTILLNETQLGKEFRARGLYPAEESSQGQRVRVSYYDHKRESKVDKRVRVYRMFSLETLEAYMKERHGFEVDHGDQGEDYIVSEDGTPEF